MRPEQRLRERIIELPSPPPPVATYRPVAIVDGIAYVSGQGPVVEGEPRYTGLVGSDVSEGDARDAARICAINAVAILRQELGSLDRVVRIVKLLGFVASAPGFHRQPFVMNGASEFLNQLFPDGHARSAIGTSVLPFNIPVEVEVIAQVSQRDAGNASATDSGTV